MDIDQTLTTAAPDAAPRPSSANNRLPLLAATDLQDHLLVATNDMDRLQRLINDAGQALLTHFHAAAGNMKQMLRETAKRPDIDASSLNLAMDHLAAAITSLQFQDMALQLVSHTRRRLRGCADRLATDAMEIDAEEDLAFVDTVPSGAETLVQAEKGTGAVELF